MNNLDIEREIEIRQKRLLWLGVRSTGSERIEEEINELRNMIDREMGQSYALYKPPQMRSDRFNRLVWANIGFDIKTSV